MRPATYLAPRRSTHQPSRAAAAANPRRAGRAPRSFLLALERDDQLALLGRELLRDFHLHLHKLGAAHVEAVELRRALVGDAHRGARLRAGRQVELHVAVDGRHRDLGTEDGVDVAELDVRVDVHAVPPEARVGRHLEEDVQVARRPALGPRVTLAAHAQPVAVVDARRDRDRDLLALLLHTLAVARAAVLLDHVARAAARGAPRLLLHPPQDRLHRLCDHAAAAALRARGDGRTRRDAAARACAASLEVRDADLLLAAEEGGIEVDLEVEPQVVALRWPPAARAAAALLPSEKGLENVAEVEVLHPRAGAARSGAADARHPKLVVPRAHVRVREHLVRLVDLLELLLGALLLVDVRVPLARRLPVRVFDLLVGRLPPDAQLLVEVNLHRDATDARGLLPRDRSIRPRVAPLRQLRRTHEGCRRGRPPPLLPRLRRGQQQNDTRQQRGRHGVWPHKARSRL
mmetsp:Transcript_24806/g.72704  ORF Transcript_24806/g.72704 Transcript_24806/m.72704 type:complete len:461 (+) Transcript_24806:257-1639(+)